MDYDLNNILEIIIDYDLNWKTTFNPKDPREIKRWKGNMTRFKVIKINGEYKDISFIDFLVDQIFSTNDLKEQKELWKELKEYFDLEEKE